MKTLIILMIVLAGSWTTSAKLNSGPQIKSVRIDSNDSATVYLQISELPKPMAVSTNAGDSFSTFPGGILPDSATTNLRHGPRKYVLVDSAILLRSDDSGITWTNTAARKYLREQTDKEIEQEKRDFDNGYSERLPQRSAFWHPTFAGVTLLYCVFIVAFLREESGWLSAVRIALCGAATLGLAWSLLAGFSHVIHWMANAQWPSRFWNTSSEFNPSVKTGIAMAIAAKPLPLLCYLLVLAMILPGTYRALILASGSRTAATERLFFAASIVAGVVFVGFHIWMIFVGYFNG